MRQAEPVRIEPRRFRSVVGIAAADPDFLADCDKQRLECDSPSTGQQIQQIVADVYTTSPDVIARLQKVQASKL